jgi:hypothetical protein
MKIVFVAVFNSTSTNNSQSRGFKRAGAEVMEYNYRVKAKELGSNSARDTDLVDTCRLVDPDLVVFSKCNGVDVSVVERCNYIGAKTCLWYMDPMGNFNAELVQKIHACSLSCFALTEPYETALSIEPSKVSFVREGFDPDIDKPVDTPKIHDTTFIGGFRGVRGPWCAAVGAHQFTDVYGRAHAKAVSSTRINLNFTDGGTSDRTYKVLAAGGFLLTQPWPGMEKDFVPGVDLDIFTTREGLREKVRFYLENPVIREGIAESGRRSVQKFSRDNWAKRIILLSRAVD